MRNLLAKRKYDQPLARLHLHLIWYVDADSTYDVIPQSRHEGAYIAIRTLTGLGRLELRNGSVLELASNSLAILDARQIMHYAASRNGWQFYWFVFDMTGSAPAVLNRTATISMSAQEQVELERCFQSLSRTTPSECLMAESLFTYLMADWLTRVEFADRNGLPLQDLLALLEKGRRERLSIAELAREAGMCERSFRNAVHAATGLSPKSYILRGEMAAAMELLRTTRMTVSEISACLNYASPFYFSRVFKKYYGISPQQVREGIRL